jgi:hypothetical protein
MSSNVLTNANGAKTTREDLLMKLNEFQRGYNAATVDFERKMVFLK